MSAMPQVPPRPSRTLEKPSAAATGGGGNVLASDMPRIPPRPVNRRIERSQSPHRESFARSPFNEIPSNLEKKNKSSSIYSSGSENPSSSDLLHRPASVVLPSIGQEGSEYAEAFEVPDSLATSPPQTRSVANDLKLHAPKPSLPQSSAKQRVSTVTRTDSEQAAALGLGKAGSDRVNPSSQSLKSKSSLASLSSSRDTERRPSSSHGQNDESIPEIGLRVPMYRDAGDVQAPSPQPSTAIYTPGVGFFNDGSQKPRHHGRRLSGKGLDLPPGSYGLHGHGVIPHDKFEKAYYEKHPELLQKECGQYGGAIGDSRGEFVLSSEDLNKLVRETASRGSGLGTSSTAIGTPSDQIGFQASEEYTSRMSSPHPHSIYHNRPQSNASQTHIESPLRRESNPVNAEDVSASLGRSLHAPSELALESDFEDDNTIHVDEPSKRINKIYGGAGHADSTEDLRPRSEVTETGDEYVDEHGYSAPILASDEVAKEPLASWEMQPAVSPKKERRSSHEHDSVAHYRSGSVSSLSSRPSSRPTSIHGGIPGMREAHSTPLEDLDEYEPLFPDDEKNKPETAADRLKRPELKNRKFPSQDIWEDTPNSLQYTATVSTPQVPEEKEEGSVMKNLKVRENETPAQAFARRQEELAESESSDSGVFLSKENTPWAKPTAIPAHLASESRPSMKQRFPSRDIWEDSPDSLQLQTTVSGPQTPEADILSPPEERPTTGAVAYHQEKLAAGFPLGEEEGRATTGIAAIMRPQIPARPTKTKSLESGSEGGKTSAPPSIPERPSQKRNIIPPAFAGKPSIPERSKPTIPARPSRFARETSQEGLTRVTSAGSAKSQGSESDQGLTAAKPKPPVPSRPVGSKIAALQGGFMSDLNKRLQLGPMGPKKEEPKPSEDEVVQEKAPLSDARKGRARGPARRAPAKSPAPAMITTALPDAVVEKLASLGFSAPMVQWSINLKDGSFTITPQHVKDEPVKATESSAPPLATNTSGDALHPSDAGVEKPVPSTSSIEDAQAAQLGETRKEGLASTTSEEPQMVASIIKASDASPLTSTHASPVDEGGNEDDLTASTGTLKPLVESKEEGSPSGENEAHVMPSTDDEIKTEREVVGEDVASGHEEIEAVKTNETTNEG